MLRANITNKNQRLLPPLNDITRLLLETQNLFSPQIIQQMKMRQEKFEKDLANQKSQCYIEPNFSPEFNLKPELFRAYLRSQFYNFELIEKLRCYTGLLLQSSPGQLQSIRRVLSLDKAIGGESVAGTAFSADLEGANGTFVIKAPQRESDSLGLLHEYVVGMYGTNRLRRKIPNFSYVFGYFSCIPPMLNQNRDVLTWCARPDGNPVNYVIYENITDAVSIFDYVAKCSDQQFLQIFTQIVLALRLAVKEIGFTHYDLHTDNVLIRRIPRVGTSNVPEEGSFYIKYETNKGLKFLLTNRIATIIDYGRSHINYRGVNLGFYDLIGGGPRPDIAFPMIDLFKLLCGVVISSLTANNVPVFREAEKIMKIFDPTDSVIDIIKSQGRNYYMLPSTKTLVNFTCDDFLDAMYGQGINMSFLQDKPLPKARILGCKDDGGTDPCLQGSLISEKLYKAPQFFSLLDVYDYNFTHDLTLDKATIDRLANDAKEFIYNELLVFDTVIKNINAKNFLSVSPFRTPNGIDIYRSFLNAVGVLYDIYYKIFSYNTALKYFGYPEINANNERVTLDNLLRVVQNEVTIAAPFLKAIQLNPILSNFYNLLYTYSKLPLW